MVGPPNAKMLVSTKRDDLCDKCIELFKAEFDGNEPSVVACGPARVNLIGEHTDYQMGFVFPMAINMKTVVACRLTEARKVRIFSSERGAVEFAALPTAPPDVVEWWCYIVGTIHEFCAVAGLPLPTGLDIALCCDIPIGGGLSSSAALEVATCTAMEQLYDRQLAPIDKAEKVCQRAEHVWVKMPCGLMDQAICTLAKENHAMLFDCKSKDARHAPMSDDVGVLVVNSGVQHQLVDGHYAKRKAKCQEAVDVIKETHPEIESLRDCSLDMLNASKCRMDEEAYKRGHHVIAECKRCLLFAEKLENQDWSAAGCIMYEGHQSLSEVYDVSIEEIDKIVEIAKSVPGVYGARLTGGGFGGCVVVLVDNTAAESAAKQIMGKYEEYFKSRVASEGVAMGKPSVCLVKASMAAHIYRP